MSGERFVWDAEDGSVSLNETTPIAYLTESAADDFGPLLAAAPQMRDALRDTREALKVVSDYSDGTEAPWWFDDAVRMDKIEHALTGIDAALRACEPRGEDDDA